MNPRNVRWAWLWIVLLLVGVGLLLLKGAQPRMGPLDPRMQLIRSLAAVNDTSLAETLDESMLQVPAGDFIRGSDAGEVNEGPQQLIYLDAFEIDQYEVTNIQYSRFLAATGRKAPAYWRDGRYPRGQADYPVVGVSWKDADAYCAWAGKRLPTEAEWEKACRGSDGNLYPWGDSWDPRRGNVDHVPASPPQPTRDGSTAAWSLAWDLLQSTPAAGQLGLQPVGSHPEGASIYGVMDLVGNASEWVFDWYNWSDYSRLPTQNPVSLGPPWNHCVRGSAWYDPSGTVERVPAWSRCSARSSAHSIADPRTGFRCARSVPPDE